MVNLSFLYIIVLALSWGPSYVFIKIAMYDLSALTLVTSRVTIATLVLIIWINLKKIKLPRDFTPWFHAFMMGLLSCSIPFYIYGNSLVYTDSIIGGISNGALPIFTSILAVLFLKQEVFNKYKFLGLLLGLVGFVALFIPTFQDGITNLDSVAVVGCFIASLFYSMGMVYAKKFLSEYRTITLPTMQLITASFYLIPICLIVDKPWQNDGMTVDTIISVLALGLVATAFAFVIYYKVISQKGAVVLSMVGYLLPVVSAITGKLVLDEDITIYIVLALAFVLLGMYFANKKID